MKVWDIVTNPTKDSRADIRAYGKSPDASASLMGRLLHFALSYSPGLALTLVQAGAKVSVKNPNGETTDKVCVRYQRVDIYAQVLEALERDLSLAEWIEVVESAVSKPPFLGVALKQLGPKAKIVLSVGTESLLTKSFGPESLTLMVRAGLDPKKPIGISFLWSLMLSPKQKGTIEAAVSLGADTGSMDSWGDYGISDSWDSVEPDEIGFLVPGAEFIDLDCAFRNRYGTGLFFTVTDVSTGSFGELLKTTKRFDAILQGFEESSVQFATCLQARNFQGQTPIHSCLKSIVSLNEAHDITPDPLYEYKMEYLNKVLDAYGHAVGSYVSNAEEFLTVGDENGDTLLSLGVDAKAYDFLSLPFIADYVDSSMWQKFVRKTFVREALIYTTFAFLYTAVGIFEHRRGHITYSTDDDWTALGLQIGVILLGIWLFISEIVEFRFRGTKNIPVTRFLGAFSSLIPEKLKSWIEKQEYGVVSVYEYLVDISNVLDGGMLLVLFTSCIGRFFLVTSGYEEPTHFERVVFGLNGIVIWIRCLNYSRQSERLGPLLHMIEEMVRDVVNFMFLFAVFLFAFTTAFFWINYSAGRPGGLDQFESFFATLLWLLEIFFGNFEFADHENENVIVNRLLYILYLIIAFILLLNLLIAMLSSSYARVESKAVNQFNMDRVELCIKYDKLNTSSEEKAEKLKRQNDLIAKIRRDVPAAVDKVLQQQRERLHFTVAHINDGSIDDKIQDVYEASDFLLETIDSRWSK